MLQQKKTSIFAYDTVRSRVKQPWEDIIDKYLQDNPELRIYEDFLPLVAKKQITLHDLKTSSYRQLWNYQALSDIASFIEYHQQEDWYQEQERKNRNNV